MIMEIIFRILTEEDIESINVLKGAAASALYGERAAAGVIVITTKKGKSRKDDRWGITLSSEFRAGFVDKSTFPKYQNMYGAGYNEDLRQVTVNGKKVWVPPFASDASIGEQDSILIKWFINGMLLH